MIEDYEDHPPGLGTSSVLGDVVKKVPWKDHPTQPGTSRQPVVVNEVVDHVELDHQEVDSDAGVVELQRGWLLSNPVPKQPMPVIHHTVVEGEVLPEIEPVDAIHYHLRADHPAPAVQA